MGKPSPVFAWPVRPLTLRTNTGRDEVYDTLRRRWLALTPEEFVRQQLLLHLQLDLHVPKQLIAVEKGVGVAAHKGRFDVVAYGRSGQPRLLAECKHPDLHLSSDAIAQAARYNEQLGATWLLITNGTELWVYARGSGSQGYEPRPMVPPFAEWAA